MAATPEFAAKGILPAHTSGFGVVQSQAQLEAHPVQLLSFCLCRQLEHIRNATHDTAGPQHRNHPRKRCLILLSLVQRWYWKGEQQCA